MCSLQFGTQASELTSALPQALKGHIMGTGEMAQELRVFAVPAEDLSRVSGSSWPSVTQAL